MPAHLSSEAALAEGPVVFLMIRFPSHFICYLELPGAHYDVDCCLLKSSFYLDPRDTILSWLTSVLSDCSFFVSFLALFLLQIPYILFLRLPSFLFSGLSSRSCPLQSPWLSLDYISSPDFSAELHGTAWKGLT